jgi:hypothetical protein
MRILVAVPAISLAMSAKIPSLKSFLSIEKFTPTIDTLDVFPHEMGPPAEGFWTINVPLWPMEATGTRGVAGPGLPHDELFFPKYLSKNFAPLCGKYDKWRPYPAKKPLSTYNVDMAQKFTKKRCKMFEKVVEDMPCDILFYVEQSPASIAHVNKSAAIDAAELVISSTMKVAARHPAYEFVIFSPYGIGSSPGFVVSRRMDAKLLTDWNELRKYLNGDGIEGPPKVSTD